MEFFDAVIRYETDLWSHAERALRDAGVGSLADLEGVRAIAAHGDTCRVHEVSRALGITIGAASKLVDRLERSGLARRRPNPADGRSSFVALTADGERHRTAGEAVLSSAIGVHLARSGVDVAAVTRALGRLRAAIAESAGVPA
jgi:DNA-binding MarR family transcriptional regulator